jgi:hypothetical protein
MQEKHKKRHWDGSNYDLIKKTYHYTHYHQVNKRNSLIIDLLLSFNKLQEGTIRKKQINKIITPNPHNNG